MILQALTEYYNALRASGAVIAAPGWGTAKISFALYLREDGSLERVVSLQTEQPRGKKTVLAPREDILVPRFLEERTSGTKSYFLCDNSEYILGVDSTGKPERALERFLNCKTLHEKILSAVDAPAARAVLAFFQSWEPEKAKEYPALAEHWEDILSGVNLVFHCAGGFAHEDPAVCAAWDRYYSQSGDGPEMVCLVTGEKGPIARLHPSIKGVINGKTMGNSLVSFNDSAYESYGCVKAQGRNAPTSQYAAFAYTTALNYLLAHDRFQMGDASVVFWAKSGEEAYSDFYSSFFRQTYEEKDIREMVRELCKGHQVLYDETLLDPNMEFCVLGLSPNAARLSVRFFFRNSFGDFLKNIEAHRERLKIVRPADEKYEVPSLKALLDATVNQNSRDKQASPELAGEILRAVLNDTPYPASLLNGVVLRIRAERKISWPRAAILKAYYLKNPNKDVPKEVLNMSLNEESTNVPYVLGRLFSVLEDIQQKANPSINSTIKDKYFNSASSTPAVVFPGLVNLAQKHLKKLPEGRQRIFYEKQLQSIVSKLGEMYPARLNLPQQGSFQLGYYHQTQTRFEKKEEKNNV